jgi:4-hydroxy-tetrahydrodipicolinate synthase
MRAIYDAVTGGDGERAREIDAELRPIYDATMVTSNPIPVKAALEMLGVIEGHVRLPMVPASEQERALVRAALERHGLLVAGGAG